MPLHDLKIGVWCALSGNRIIGPIFFNETVNTNVHLQVYSDFSAQLTPKEKRYAYFQQDGNTCHTSDLSLTTIHTVFTAERTIGKGLWPPRSPDLSPCDYFLWGFLKSRVYHNNPRTIDTLKNNIRQEISNIPQRVLRNVFNNMLKRAELCFVLDGEHFEHRL